MDVLVVEIEGLRVKELDGSVLPSLNPDGKELMLKYAWMALVTALKS